MATDCKESPPAIIYRFPLAAANREAPLWEGTIHKGQKKGRGTYGTVYACVNKQEGKQTQNLAIKRNIVDYKSSFTASVRELSVLRYIQHPYVVRLIGSSFGNPFAPNGFAKGETRWERSSPTQKVFSEPFIPSSPIKDHSLREDKLFFIFEQSYCDGHSAIYKEKLSPRDLMKCLVQVLLALEYMHSKGLIHRDLKPSNLLIFKGQDMFFPVDNGYKNSNTVLPYMGWIAKICDFGLSKFGTKQEPMTPRTATSWYRAPEIICSNYDYDSQADMWSIGCTLYEMIVKRALLYGVEDDNSQLYQNLFEALPSAIHEDLRNVDKKNKFSPPILQNKNPRNWETLLKKLNINKEYIVRALGCHGSDCYEQYIDLLKQMLQPIPSKRCTATEALNHPLFKLYAEEIANVRKNYVPQSQGIKQIEIINCLQREAAMIVACGVYNARKTYSKWYSNRILFQAIDIYDRYLIWVRNNKLTADEIDIKLKQPISNGQNKEEDILSEFKFMICLYLALKLLTTTRISTRFSDIIHQSYRNDKCLEWASHFEHLLISKVCNFHVYRATVYEEADNLDKILEPAHIKGLLGKHCIVESTITTVKKLLYDYLPQLFDHKPEELNLIQVPTRDQIIEQQVDQTIDQTIDQQVVISDSCPIDPEDAQTDIISNTTVRNYNIKNSANNSVPRHSALSTIITPIKPLPPLQQQASPYPVQYGKNNIVPISSYALKPLLSTGLKVTSIPQFSTLPRKSVKYPTSSVKPVTVVYPLSSKPKYTLITPNPPIKSVAKVTTIPNLNTHANYGAKVTTIPNLNTHVNPYANSGAKVTTIPNLNTHVNPYANSGPKVVATIPNSNPYANSGAKVTTTIPNSNPHSNPHSNSGPKVATIPNFNPHSNPYANSGSISTVKPHPTTSFAAYTPGQNGFNNPKVATLRRLQERKVRMDDEGYIQVPLNTIRRPK